MMGNLANESQLFVDSGTPNIPHVVFGDSLSMGG
jgi:hypothetical protein